jgi:hypothetical protein
MCGRPTPGAALDLSKTARQLGLTGGEGGTARVWVEERAEVLMSLKLRRGQGTAVELRVPPTMSFGEIKRRWLQQHGGGQTARGRGQHHDAQHAADAERLATRRFVGSDLARAKEKHEIALKRVQNQGGRAAQQRHAEHDQCEAFMSGLHGVCTINSKVVLVRGQQLPARWRCRSSA